MPAYIVPGVTVQCSERGCFRPATCAVFDSDHSPLGQYCDDHARAKVDQRNTSST